MTVGWKSKVERRNSLDGKDDEEEETTNSRASKS
jgi:hypothetical protein